MFVLVSAVSYAYRIWMECLNWTARSVYFILGIGLFKILQQEECRDMKIFVDADACPVVRETEEVAEKYSVPVVLLCDTNHILQSAYSEVKVIGAGADAVDFALVNLCKAGDLVVTQDYGVAAMALGKKAYAIHQNGWQYTNENIERLLMERHLVKKARRASGKNHLKGPRKRTTEDNCQYKAKLERLLKKIKAENDT